MYGNLIGIQHALKTYASGNPINWPWLNQMPLSMKNANKFILGAIIDYQIGANKAWSNAKTLAETTFRDPPHLWNYIVQHYTTQAQWDQQWVHFNIHRFPVAHSRVWRIASDIVRLYGGDSRKIWQGANANSCLDALEKLRCGPAISRMIVGALIDCNHLKGNSVVKPDRHVKRVLGRIFNEPNINSNRAIQLANHINPGNSWAIDAALYKIGKIYCRPTNPNYTQCPIGPHCLFAQATACPPRGIINSSTSSTQPCTAQPKRDKSENI